MGEQKTKILIVEDDPFLLDLYKELLEDEGFLVEVAKDGEEGLKKMKEGGYALTILDIMLPKKDGLEILKELSEKEKKDCGQIVMLTNLGQDQVIKDGFKLGAAGYLIKSALTPEQVLHEVRVFLGQEK